MMALSMKKNSNSTVKSGSNVKFKKEKKTTTSSAQLIPVKTNFDYLNGTFKRAQLLRRVYLGLATLALIVSGSFVFLGIQADTVANSEDEARADVLSRDVNVTKDLNQLDQVNGIPAADLRAHAVARQGIYVKAVEEEVNMPVLVNQLFGIATSGVTINRIELINPKAPLTADGSSSSSAPPASGSAKPSEEVAATMTGSVTSYSAARDWVSALSDVQGLELTTEPVVAGNLPNIQITATFKLNEDLYTNRAQSLDQLDQYGLPKGEE